MNKKILAILLILAMQTPVFAGSYIDKQLKETKKNVKYNSVSTHTTRYSAENKRQNLNVKDPKLIKLSSIPQVDEQTYKNKLLEDEKTYKSSIIPAINTNLSSINIQPANIDFYKVYRISERLIRANNLEYMNWRIAIRKSEDQINAASTAANFVWINTALYDSLYTNEDGLAIVIAHEMAHHILGHQQRQAELTRKLVRLAKRARYIDTELGNSGAHLSAKIQMKRIHAESRMMEYMADAQAAELVTRAGFNLDKGIEAYNLFNALPHVKTLDDTHPQPEERIKSLIENRATFPVEWTNEGKANIINSDVLQCKKSSDRVSIVINANYNAKTYYQPENLEQKLRRIAYMNYRNGDMEKAIKYFEKLNDITNDYVSYLYISYANEYLYNITKENKYLKASLKSANSALELNNQDEYAIEQVKNITNLLSSLQ